MKQISIILVIYAFIKNIYYGIYEIKQKENKPGGIAVIVLAIIGLILPISVLYIYY